MAPKVRGRKARKAKAKGGAKGKAKPTSRSGSRWPVHQKTAEKLALNAEKRALGAEARVIDAEARAAAAEQQAPTGNQVLNAMRNMGPDEAMIVVKRLIVQHELPFAEV